MNNIHVRYLVFYLFALVFQAALADYIQIFYWQPDVLLIVLVAYALRSGQIYGVIAGFFVGLSQDIISAHIFGLAALSKTIAGFLAGTFHERFSAKTEFILTLVICGIAHDFIYFFFSTLGENFSFQSLLILYALPNIMYTTIVGWFIHYLISQWLSEPES